MGSGAGKRPSAVAPPTYGDLTIYVAQDPVDFRLGINGLSTMVEATLRFDPFSRNLFCFTNKRRNQIKVLYWQRSGAHSGQGDHSFRRMATTHSRAWRPVGRGGCEGTVESVC